MLPLKAAVTGLRSLQTYIYLMTMAVDLLQQLRSQHAAELDELDRCDFFH